MVLPMRELLALSYDGESVVVLALFPALLAGAGLSPLATSVYGSVLLYHVLTILTSRYLER